MPAAGGAVVIEQWCCQGQVAAWRYDGPVEQGWDESSREAILDVADTPVTLYPWDRFGPDPIRWTV